MTKVKMLVPGEWDNEWINQNNSLQPLGVRKECFSTFISTLLNFLRVFLTFFFENCEHGLDPRESLTRVVYDYKNTLLFDHVYRFEW